MMSRECLSHFLSLRRETQRKKEKKETKGKGGMETVAHHTFAYELGFRYNETIFLISARLTGIV